MPTRGDPELFKHAVETMERTQSGRADLFYYVAEDDPKLAEYHALDATLNHGWIHGLYGAPLGFSRGVNELARRAMEWDEYTLLARGEDDFEWQGECWDICYLDRAKHRFPDGVGMTWCNYVLKGPEAEPQTAAIGHEWYRALGWFSLPTIRHYYCDNVLLDLARAIGRAEYIPLPLVKHNWDPKPAYGDWATDERAYQNYRMEGEFGRDVVRLQKMIEYGGAE